MAEFLTKAQHQQLFGLDVDITGAQSAFDAWKLDIDQELAKAYAEIGDKVMRKALPKVPVKSGDLKADMRMPSSARAANIRVGRAKVPYAGPAHWGWQQVGMKTPFARRNQRFFRKSKPGPKFLWLTVYPNDTSQQGPAEWIENIIVEAVNNATGRLNRKGRKSVEGISLR